jgi:hypothetical protein
MPDAHHLRLGVIGDPVEHSISPAMQQPALNAMGIPATYERWHTPLVELPARIESLRAEDVLGANVTVPHKEHVLSLVDEVSDLRRHDPTVRHHASPGDCAGVDHGHGGCAAGGGHTCDRHGGEPAGA